MLMLKPAQPTARVPMNIPVTDMPKIAPLTPLTLEVMAASGTIKVSHK